MTLAAEIGRTLVILVCVVTAAATAAAQSSRPSLRVGALPPIMVIDGELTEAAWQSADAIEDFRQTDPAEGAAPSSHTRVQVLADRHSIVIGVVCDVADPSQIVSFSVQRDSPDLSLSSYIQYDTDSESVGANTRLRWTFKPIADLFIVYNHNIRSIVERWRLDSNQLLVKLQYALRM